ncbi:MAG: sulfatase, partial [Myxococcales bacterium]|nr:sulfatase [Myxococcales bacterium]
RSSPHELALDGSPLPEMRVGPELLALEGLADGSFTVVGDELLLLDRQVRFAGKELVYTAWIERAVSPRFTLPGVTSDGWGLLAGESLTFELPDVQGRTAELVFGTRVFGSERGALPSQIVLTLDGAEVFRALQDAAMLAPIVPRRVVLPDFQGGRLTVEVRSGDGVTQIANPVLHQSDRAHPPSRPPDIVVFLADTFRADNLAAWGADPGLAPHMNAFAETGLAFTAAHAPATWTLPSQASMLTSLYPYQHGAVRHDRRLPPGLDTLPGRLSAAGYRTAAVTDGILVTQRHGLDSGFELFLEAPPDKDFAVASLARVRDVLAMDDGRPLFLFVQTYRTHAPYVATPATLAAHPALFGKHPEPEDWKYAPLAARLGAAVRASLSGEPEAEAEARAAAATLERLYRGGVADLDRGFGQLLELLDETGHGAGIVVLTSDHGESFLEHRALSHGTSVLEAEAWVPLVLAGAGIPAGLSEANVNLIDLAPTLAELADVAPAPSWQGRSLLGPSAGLSVSFEAEIAPGPKERRFALFDGRYKLTGLMQDGRVLERIGPSFDLAVDPGEEHELGADEAPWSAPLFERARGDLERWTRPVGEFVELELTSAESASLRAMGYLGD